MRPNATVLVLLMLAPAAPAAATTITVATDGSAMYYHIQQGVNAAGSGDTVRVAAGTYANQLDRNIDFHGKAVSLIAPSGWSSTVIDCEGLGRGFFFETGEDTTTLVSGFHIVNAVADSGAGAFCINGSAPKFYGCRFEACNATDGGGGLCCRGSSPVVRECAFVGNESSGGIYSYGGGMECWVGSAAVVSGTLFESNSATTGGGALMCQSSPSTFINCDFVENNVGAYAANGTAVCAGFSDGIVFADCRFTRNGLSQIATGGAIQIDGCDITVSDCAFVGNRAGTGAGMRLVVDSSGTVSGCTFAGNDSDWSYGAGIACFSGSEITISGCTFVLNGHQSLVCQDSSPTVEYCIFASTMHGAVTVCNETSFPQFSHCFVYGNVGGDTLCGGNYSDIEYEDPLLCDAPGGDYTLCADSPCLPGATWPSLVGSQGEGCDACGSAVEPSTWSRLKSLYR